MSSVATISSYTDFWMPFFHDMRTLPEFKDFLRERGFVDYWRSTGNWGDYCKAISDFDFECQ